MYCPPRAARRGGTAAGCADVAERIDVGLLVGIIGLDTSHSVEFPRRMQAPDCPVELRVDGMRARTCLRFATPFTTQEILDRRQAELESWGVKVTEDPEETIAGCDALMLEINDPALHLPYFQKCAHAGLPVFIDKPLADSAANGRQIVDVARRAGVPIFSASSLRFTGALKEACAAIPNPVAASTYGPLGKAPAGSSIVWYGVHAFEMLQRALGGGAVEVQTHRDGLGVVCVVRYANARRGVVELSEGGRTYGGRLQTLEACAPFTADAAHAYTDQLREVLAFFRTGASPVQIEDTLEVMAMLDAAERSLQSGKPERV